VDAESRQQRVIAALCDPRRYPHPVAQVEHLETHISHVLLAGDFAYKIKKPLNLGFLDFSDLRARRSYCEKELRLNRRSASALYLEVIPIGGSEHNPVLGGSGPAIEYALKMRRFPQEALFSRMLDRGELTAGHIDALAAQIARFHAEIETAKAGSSFGEPQAIEQPALQNFAQLAPLLKNASDTRLLDSLRSFTEQAHLPLREIFSQRKRQGFTRECHGDLHLENIAWYDRDATLFDCIEFNEQLRWIDVMSEVAFVMMDLCARGHAGFAYRLLNAYLERTGDYGGLRVLRYYLIYRALVRAKVLELRTRETGAIAANEANRIRGYLSLAQRFAVAGRAAIIITHGVSGSGKSTLAQRLLEDSRAIRVRSDVERKRLLGLASGARTGSAPGRGLYAQQATQDTYAELERLARIVAEAGYPVIVDATFLKRGQRERFRTLAAALNIRFAILDCRAPEGVLRTRVAEREARGRDPSEADLTVLENQLGTRERLQPDERESSIIFDSEGANWQESLRALAVRIGKRQ
jgi:aminoglycoside phosphotransferase family enzyme/predicted kinase